MTLEWISFPDARMRVDGLPWFGETAPHLHRLPPRLQHLLPEPHRHTVFAPAGARLRFATDSPSLGLRLHYPDRRHLYNLSAVGAMGVDLYVDGSYWGTAAPVQNGTLETVLYTEQPPYLRDVGLYLPLYHPVEVAAMGVEPGATFSTPAAYALSRPVVIYGSSITQGGCASRSGASYPAVLGRMLGLDFINLAFSGHANGELGMADALAEIEACAYVLDYGQNHSDAEALERVYGPFLDRLRAGRPGVPILCLSPLFVARELHSPRARARHVGLREAIRACVSARSQADPQLAYVDGLALLGSTDAECLTDGVHPGDRGFYQIAERLQAILARLLELPNAPR